jgi:formylglycine-generating enzyme required for sulfatase activity
VFAGRVRDRIASSFGEDSVFIDVDNIPFGTDFRVHIQEALAKADAVLVAGKGGQSRIANDTDPVRIEVETALSKEIPTIPILVGRTNMPKPEQLPESLRSFAFINAASVDTGRDFHRDLDRVIATISTILERSNVSAEREFRSPFEAQVTVDEPASDGKGRDTGAKHQEAAAETKATALAQPSKRALVVGSLLFGVAISAAAAMWWFAGARPTPVTDAPTIAPLARAVAPMQATVGPEHIGAAALSQEQERALKPKDTFKECEDCPEMVVVPSGSFTMGSPVGESGHDSDEGPLHRATLASPFAVGKFALTFGEWDACVAGGGCNAYKPNDQGWGRGRLPVINVSWNDAKAYLAWLSKKTGKSYRLLSETEREYVTRAGTTTPFWWGDSISTNQANYDGNYIYGSGLRGSSRGRTVVVDSFEANPWGLFQVHGNVWEWVEDCFRTDYAKATSDGSPMVLDDCGKRVLRGASWDRKPTYLRSAARLGWDPSVRDNSFGFRVARSWLETKSQ